MSTERVRLNITLPFSIAEELKQMTASRKRSQFIAEAIRLRIMHLKEKKLELDEQWTDQMVMLRHDSEIYYQE